MAKSLESQEQVVRYVGGLNFDQSTGRVDGTAFDRRPKDHDGLSFTRRHVFSSEEEADRNQIRLVFASTIKVGATAKFAQLEVGKALDSLRYFDDIFDFIDDPLDAEGDALANPAHALMVGLPFAGEAVGSLRSELAGDLIAKCVNLVFDAK